MATFIDDAEIKQRFANEISKAGLTPPAVSDIIADNEWKKFKGLPEKSGNSSSYSLTILPDGTYVGCFKDYRLGDQVFPFCSKATSSFTPEQKKAFAVALEEARKKAAEEEARKHAKVAEISVKEWESGKTDFGTHYYLDTKKVTAYGLRVNQAGNLMSPIFVEGKLMSLQLIAPEGKSFFCGNKMNMKGGKTTGGYYLIEGKDGGDDSKLVFVEGLATGLTCSEAWGYQVVVCYSANQIENVVKYFRSLYPDKPFIIAGDNDWETKKPIDNPGVHYAKKAAKKYDCKVVFPEFRTFVSGHKDFNDLAALEGIDAVKKHLKRAKKTKALKEEEKGKAQKVSLPDTAVTSESDVIPSLQANGVDMLELSQKAWDAILKKNAPLKYFKTLDGLVSLTSKEDYLPKMESITSDKMRYILSNSARFYDTGRNGDIPCFPPKELAANLLVFDYDKIPLPYLKKVITSPAFSQKGEIHTEQGYSEKTKCYFHKADGLDVPEISESPSEEDVIKARNLLFEVWYDFPFDSEADRSNAIAMTIQPYVQELISANSPLFSIIAPTAGTGKSLFVEIIALIYSGKENKLGSTPDAKDDEEWRKKITAILSKRPSIVWIDNVKYKLDSGALSNALTNTVWDDRVLSQSNMISLPSDVLWVCTGNNVQFSTEIARRVVPIRIDAKVERPAERDPENYLHPDLREWVSENRGELLWACLTLAQNWIALGKPKPQNVPQVGSFETWRKVIGGILESAGIKNFLGNLKTLYDDSDSEGDALKAMLTAWYNLKGYDQDIIAGELYDMVKDQKIPVQIGGKTERAERVKMGYLLKGMKDRHFKLLIGDDDSNSETIEVVVRKGGLLHGAQKWVLRKPGLKSESLPFERIDSRTPSPLKAIEFVSDRQMSESNECFLNRKAENENKKIHIHDTHDHDHAHMCEGGTMPPEIITFHSANPDKGFSGVNVPVNLVAGGHEFHSVKNCTSCKLFRTNGDGKKKCFFTGNPVEIPKAGTFNCDEWISTLARSNA